LVWVSSGSVAQESVCLLPDADEIHKKAFHAHVNSPAPPFDPSGLSPERYPHLP
jgi:hypothetical protein